MKAEKDINKIAKIFDTRTKVKVKGVAAKITRSTDAYFNLSGVLHDIEHYGKIDKVGIRTLKRISSQLGRIREVLRKAGALNG